MTTECWLWAGPTLPNGYGRLWLNGRKVYAHRVAYELAVGPIPDDREIHHLCEVRRCCRPDHLVAVTKREHGAQHWRATCAQGHAMVGENVLLRRRKGGPDRACRTCWNSYQRARRAHTGEN
jgi:hypothetical protein